MRLAVTVCVLFVVAASGLGFEKVKNCRRLRGVASSLPIFRAASLDNGTVADFESLQSLDGLQLGRVIDLRNADEIAKGARTRSASASAFYAASPSVVVHRPLLGDIDAFWVAVSEEAPPLAWERFSMLWSARPLNAALSRALEDGGLASLYRAILSSAPREIGRVVDECIASAERGEAVVFHCQKGKDRTGLVAAILESLCGVPRSDVVASYAESGANLGGEDALPPLAKARRRANDDADVDWSRFRGSPPDAIEATLAWIDTAHGGVSTYLSTACGVDEARQGALRRCLATYRDGASDPPAA